MSTPRRSFLGRLAALLAVGSAPATLAAASRPEASAFWPDETWLEQLANREHRVIIESGTIADGLAFRRALNFLDVMNSDYHIPDARAGIAIVVHGATTALVFNDAMWAKYALGAKHGLKDAQGAPLVANPYRTGAPHAVDALTRRGAIFLACGRSLTRISRELAGGAGNADAIRAELVANLLPGARAVPAAIAAITRAQSRGVPYMAVN
jgi:intracellular sulfur oxidation DsrE/DsrF family protein